MSAAARAAGAKLRLKYAHLFGVGVESVTVEELPDDDCEVRCPERPDLPVWSTGSIPGEPSRVRFRTKMKPSKLDGWEEP